MKLIKPNKKFLVLENSTIFNIIKKLNNNASKICFVQNSKKKVIGTISDGDIRRFLLNRRTLEKNVKAKHLYNKNFLFSESLYLKEKLLKKIIKNKIEFIPIIKKGNLIGILPTKNLRKNIVSNPVLILAGGKGKRLRPATIKTPKPLLKIGGRSIIDHILSKLDRDGFRNIFISTNYLKQKFYRYKNFKKNNNLNINLIEEKKPLGTAGSLFFLKKTDFENVLVVNGDIYFEERLNKVLNFHKNKKNDITICSRRYENKIKYGAIKLNNNKFIDIEEKPKSNYLINTGIYVIKKKLISDLKKPSYIDMPSFIKKNHKAKKKIGIYQFDGLWVDIANIADLQSTNKMLIENV